MKIAIRKLLKWRAITCNFKMVLIDVPNICSLLKIDAPNSNLSRYFVLLEIFTVALQLNLQYLFLMLKVVGEFYDFLL